MNLATDWQQTRWDLRDFKGRAWHNRFPSGSLETPKWDGQVQRGTAPTQLRNRCSTTELLWLGRSMDSQRFADAPAAQRHFRKRSVGASASPSRSEYGIRCRAVGKMPSLTRVSGCEAVVSGGEPRSWRAEPIGQTVAGHRPSLRASVGLALSPSPGPPANQLAKARRYPCDRSLRMSAGLEGSSSSLERR